MTRLRLFSHGVLSGLCAGALAGVADAYGTSHEFLGRRFLAVAVGSWTLLGLVAGSVLAAAAAARVRPGVISGARSAPGLAALLSSLAFVLPAAFLALVSLNVSFLGGDTDPTTLAVDAAVLMAGAAAAFVLARILAAGFARPTSRRARWTCSPLTLILVPLLAIGVASLSWRGGSSAVGPPRTTAPPGAPDVLLVLFDTVEAGRLSGWGNPHGTTPWLDRLARRGTLFASCTSASCYTKPSVASILTSLVPSAHRVGHLRTVLSPMRTTLVEGFHDAGWRTAMIVSNTILGAEFGFAQGAELFRTLPTEELGRTKLGYALRRLGEERKILPFDRIAKGFRRLEGALVGTPDLGKLHLTSAEVDAAYRAWTASAGEAPRFAYLHYMEPHAPYRPPASDGLRFLAAGDTLCAQHPSTVGLFLPFSRADSLSDSARRGLAAAYEGEIAALDREAGKFLDEILAGERRTVIAFVSDHGEEFYEHGGWGHGQSLYEELLRVPCFFVGDGVPAASVESSPARSIDLAPTLFSLAGVVAPREMTGRAWFARGRTNGHPEPEFVSEIIYGDAYWARALKVGSKKVIVSRLGERESTELYDLTVDARERRDLAPVEPDMAQAMRATLGAMTAALESGASADSAEFDSATIERLRALGYVR